MRLFLSYQIILGIFGPVIWHECQREKESAVLFNSAFPASHTIWTKLLPHYPPDYTNSCLFPPPPPPDTLIPALYCVVFTTYPTTWPVTGCLQQDSLLSGIFSPQCPVVLRVAERLSPRGKITVRLGLHLIRDFVGAFEMFMSNALALGGPGCGCSPVVLFLCENHVTLERDANPEVIKVGFIDSLPRGENTFFSLFCSVELGVNNWSWLFCGQSNWF